MEYSVMFNELFSDNNEPTIQDNIDLQNIDNYEFIHFKPVNVPLNLKRKDDFYNLVDLITYTNQRMYLILPYDNIYIPNEKVRESLNRYAVETFGLLYNLDYIKDLISEKLNIDKNSFSISKSVQLIQVNIEGNPKILEGLKVRGLENILISDILYEHPLISIYLINTGLATYIAMDTPKDLDNRLALTIPVFGYSLIKYLVIDEISYFQFNSKSKEKKKYIEILNNIYPTATILDSKQFVDFYFNFTSNYEVNEKNFRNMFNKVVKNEESYIYIRPVMKNELWF